MRMPLRAPSVLFPALGLYMWSVPMVPLFADVGRFCGSWIITRTVDRVAVLHYTCAGSATPRLSTAAHCVLPTLPPAGGSSHRFRTAVLQADSWAWDVSALRTAFTLFTPLLLRRAYKTQYRLYPDVRSARWPARPFRRPALLPTYY